VRKHREGLFSWRCCRPRAHRQHPRRPGVADVLAPPIRCRWERRHLLPPQRSLAGELAPLLLPGHIGIQREDQLPHLPRPVLAPALHTKNGDDAGHASRAQRLLGCDETASPVPRSSATVALMDEPLHFGGG